MSYAGNTALSPKIQERIQNTFEQTQGLAEEGNRQEALLGCDFILRLDPLFEPARRLQERLNESEGPVAVEDLVGDDATQDQSENQASATEIPAPQDTIPEDSVDIGELIADAPDEAPLVGDTPVGATPIDIDLEDAPPIASAAVDEMPLEVQPLPEDAIDVMEAFPDESIIEDEPLAADVPTHMAMLLEQRNFKDLMALAMVNQDRVSSDQDLQQMVGLANERLEAEPYVRNFLESSKPPRRRVI